MKNDSYDSNGQPKWVFPTLCFLLLIVMILVPLIKRLNAQPVAQNPEPPVAQQAAVVPEETPLALEPVVMETNLVTVVTNAVEDTAIVVTGQKGSFAFEVVSPSNQVEVISEGQIRNLIEAQQRQAQAAVQK